MTPVQKWTLKLTEARGKLGDALEAAEPDAEEIQKLTREVRHADEALTAAKLVEPEPTEPVVTETRQYDSKLAELRAAVDLTKHVKAALAGTIAQGGPEAEYNAELRLRPDGSRLTCSPASSRTGPRGMATAPPLKPPGWITFSPELPPTA